MEFTNLDPLARRRRAKQEERKNREKTGKNREKKPDGSGQGAPRESGQTPRAPRRSTWGKENHLRGVPHDPKAQSPARER